MTKKELLKVLRTGRKLFAYVSYNDTDGNYYLMVKSDFIKSVLEMGDDTKFSKVTVTDESIFIN